MVAGTEICCYTSKQILIFTFESTTCRNDFSSLWTLLEFERVICRHQPSHLILYHLSVLKPQWNNRGPLSRVKLSHSNAEYSSAESSQSAFCRGSSWLLLKSQKIISSSVSLVLLPHWYFCFYSLLHSLFLVDEVTDESGREVCSSVFHTYTR